ncbi:hypothetical protein COY95_04160, partial [Candidatus Woesearchaeota archaeon CG_4_10_14_0_8_um_filter_47_5]
MYLFGREIEKKHMMFIPLAALAIAVAVVFLLSGGERGHEGELFSLIPGEKLVGASYFEMEKGGIDRAAAIDLLPIGTEAISRAFIALGEYESGGNIVSAYVEIDMGPSEIAQGYGKLLGYSEVEELELGGRKITALYRKEDTDGKNPV